MLFDKEYHVGIFIILVSFIPFVIGISSKEMLVGLGIIGELLSFSIFALGITGILYGFIEMVLVLLRRIQRYRDKE